MSEAADGHRDPDGGRVPADTSTHPDGTGAAAAGGTGSAGATDDEVVYEPCGRLGPHDPHVWLSNRRKNCTGSGEAGRTPRPGPPTVARQD